MTAPNVLERRERAADAGIELSEAEFPAMVEELLNSTVRLCDLGHAGSTTDDQRLAWLLSAAGIKTPTFVSRRESHQEFLVIPVERNAGLPRTGRGASTEVDRDWEPLVDLIADERRERQLLEQERDSLVDQISQNFEELHWLRGLAAALSSSDATTDLRTVADDVLPQLRELIRAEAVVLVPTTDAEVLSPDAVIETRLQTSGELSNVRQEGLALARQCWKLGAQQPVVFNRDSPLQTTVVETIARNVMAVPLLQSQRCYGWLVALNRIISAETATPSQPSDLNSREFGSNEVGLMTTAAGMLAGHARNVELFSAEEHLRLGVIETIAGALDARDPYTCGHSRRVAQLATRIAAHMGFSQEAQEKLYITGLVHDVGKIGIADDILKKPGQLSDDEFETIKQHPTIGHLILTPLRQLAFVLPGVLHHHERFDGRGYPHGLAGEDIPFDARILAVADSYDAMTSDRAYRPGMPAAKALAILNEGAGTQWDASVVDAMLQCTEFATGNIADRQ